MSLPGALKLLCFSVLLTAVGSSLYLGSSPEQISSARVSPLQLAVLPDAHELDSAALWRGSRGRDRLFVTARSTDLVHEVDAVAGGIVRTFGGRGNAPGEFSGPNGIAVSGDHLFVVEKRNRRVQVFQLPEFRSKGWFGAFDLHNPAGIAVTPAIDGRVTVYVTDNGKAKAGVTARVVEYELTFHKSGYSAARVREFGKSQGDGDLLDIESIALDAKFGRVLVAEEAPRRRCVKVFTLEGKFTGQVLGRHAFLGEPEGIALYRSSEDGGAWILTDQSAFENAFHLYDRRSLDYLGSFSVNGIKSTDGIAISDLPIGSSAWGALFMVSNDRNVAMVSLSHLSGLISPPDAGRENEPLA